MARSPSSSSPFALVVGGGLVGLTIAWRLLGRGWRVRVYERGAPGRGAGWAAAGMLAPAAEALEDARPDDAMVALGARSLDAWRAFADDLAGVVGRDVGLDRRGVVMAACDAASEQALRAAAASPLGRRLGVELVEGARARALEPALGAEVRLAATPPGDMQVDNRAALAAVTDAVRGAGGELVGSADAQEIGAGARPGVRVLHHGRSVWAQADAVIVAAGWGAQRFGDVPGLSGITPVKGQMLAVRVPDGAVGRVVRGHGVYIAPKRGGRVVIGATVEAGRADELTDPRAVEALRAAAGRLTPVLRDAEIVDRWAGVRPRSADGRPIIGQAAEGVFTAAGFYRNGVLYAPAAGAALAELIDAGAPPDWAAGFAPPRRDNAGGDRAGAPAAGPFAAH